MQIHSAIFYTNNLARAVAFYGDTLKFPVDYVQEGKFASFIIGDAKLGIKQAKEEREVPGHQTVFVAVEDVNALYKNAQDNGLNILKPLTEEDWATNFSLLDPDGNKVQFIQPKE